MHLIKQIYLTDLIWFTFVFGPTLLLFVTWLKEVKITNSEAGKGSFCLIIGAMHWVMGIGAVGSKHISVHASINSGLW